MCVCLCGVCVCVCVYVCVLVCVRESVLYESDSGNMMSFDVPLSSPVHAETWSWVSDFPLQPRTLVLVWPAWPESTTHTSCIEDTDRKTGNGPVCSPPRQGKDWSCGVHHHVRGSGGAAVFTTTSGEGLELWCSPPRQVKWWSCGVHHHVRGSGLAVVFTTTSGEVV